MPTRLLAFALISLLAACSKKAEQPAIATKAEAAAPDPSIIRPNEQLLKDLKIGTIEAASVGLTYNVAARVEVDETRVTRVGSPVLGRIATILVHEGQQVTKGQVLATLNSTGLSDAQLGFLKALSSRQLNQRAVDRAQQLLKADVIGAAELQRREAELAEATAELDAARDQLLLLGMTPEAIEDLRRTRTINSVARVVASMDGTVLERKVTLGQMIQPADTVFEIADLSNVWLVADVPEQQASILVEGLAVEAQLPAFPELTINGKLNFISSTLNPNTRTVHVRMNIANPKGRFKPAMLATMKLKDSTSRRPMIPLSAIVREGNTDGVFIERQPGEFQFTAVNLGEEFDGKRVLLDPIDRARKIVLDGAFHLNNERRRLNLRGSEGE